MDTAQQRNAAWIEALEVKLKAREGKSEYALNCQAIRDELARLKAIAPDKRSD